MFWEGRRGNRFLCDQSEILGCSSALSSGHCWASASIGESQKLLRLGCRREQTSPMERKGSHRAAVWCCLRLGPNRPADRFLWGQGNWQGKGLRVSSGLPRHVGSWARGFFSPSQVIGLVSGFFPGAQSAYLLYTISWGPLYASGESTVWERPKQTMRVLALI